jgi:RimJ/RimL family protein N-acetyltransferase
MFTELEKTEFRSILTLLQSIPRDPMLYSVIEGNQTGRIFVDHTSNPSVVFIWNNMEYAYLVSDSTQIGNGIAKIVEEIILPILDKDGMGFLTIFPFGVTPLDVREWFSQRKPVSFGVNSYRFESEKFEVLRTQTKPLPPDLALIKLDRQTLDQEMCQGIRDDILFCWESLEQFDKLGLGYGIKSQQHGIICACYAIGYGAQAYHINIWTHQEYRRKGLARRTAIAFLTESLQKGKIIYWINDVPNIASRRLAESVGFVYIGNLATVDIPVHPYHFHLGLAEHFGSYLGLSRQAGELYDMAFSIKAGTPDTYRKAALVWRDAGDFEKEEYYQLKAAA